MLSSVYNDLYISPHVVKIFCVVRALNSLSNFQIYDMDRVLLTVVNMLYIISQNLLNLHQLEVCALWPPSPILPILHPLPLAPVSFQFLWIWILLDFTYKWEQTIFVFLCLTSFSIMASSFIQVVTNSRISFVLGLNSIICLFILSFIPPHTALS